MSVAIGTKVRILPAGWVNSELEGIPKHVEGVVDYINEKAGFFRVKYTAKGDDCHETFKLPLIAGDPVKILG